jgi:hypothetical protein
VSGTFTFGPNETSKVISVPIAADVDPESNEWFGLALSNPTGGAKLGAQATTTVWVVEE